jgi:hypothetical protein
MKKAEIYAELYEAHERIDTLQRALALAVSLIETKLINELAVRNAFMTQAELLLNSYYQGKLPFDQFLQIQENT